MKLLITLLTLTFTANAFSQADLAPYRSELRSLLTETHKPLTDWKVAKKYLMQVVHLEQDADGFFIKEVYCNRIIRVSVGPNKFPVNRNINVEHTWPQSKFPKRKSIVQKSDLHHLYPTDSNANSSRGNFPFAEVTSVNTLEGCDASKRGYSPDTGGISFMPPAHQKGNVARALFYFSVRYNVKIPDYEEIFLRQWNLIDPVDEFEIRRNDLIEQVQGNRNIFIDEPDYVAFIRNF
jgi:deoxyribonuclease-1